jgi:hypothetical protein
VYGNGQVLEMDCSTLKNTVLGLKDGIGAAMLSLHHCFRRDTE